MGFTAILLFVFVVSTYASFDGNLNYRSPSYGHPTLGIDVSKVAKRGLSLHRRQSNSSYPANSLNYTHGVASGDPYPNSVILWTRVSPMIQNDASNVTVEGTVPLYNHDTQRYVDASSQRVCVEYRVGTDRNFSTIVSQGTAYTTSDIDYTVKVRVRNPNAKTITDSCKQVEAVNLSPYTTYYYQFTVCGSDNKSPIGRTKTTPSPDDSTSNIGLAVFSCSNYPTGYFNAYGNAARKDDVDFFVHLGDYIYETGRGTIGVDQRATNPSDTIFTLYDYRTRIAQYRTDLDLVLSHQQYAWITVWDDHGEMLHTFHGRKANSL